MCDVGDHYTACEECGALVPESNLIMHQARACESRSRPSRPEESRSRTHCVSFFRSPRASVFPLGQRESPMRRSDGIAQQQHRQQENGLRSTQQRNASPSPADPTYIWRCSRCTLFNPRTRAACAACRHPNPDVRNPHPVEFGSWRNAVRAANPNSTLLRVGGTSVQHFQGGATTVYTGANEMFECVISDFLPADVAGDAFDYTVPPIPRLAARTMSSSQLQPRAHDVVYLYFQGRADGTVVLTIILPVGTRTQRNIDPEVLLASLSFAQHGLQSLQESSVMGYEELLRTFGSGTENMGAEESDIQSLPNRMIWNVEEELPEDNERQCCICLDDFRPGHMRKALPCRHGFHADCIDKALRTRGRCPMCNANVKS